MALTMLFALLGSLLLSLTLVPALATFVVPKKVHRQGRLFGGLVRGYRALLRFGLARPAVVLGLATLLVAGGGLVATRLGADSTEFSHRTIGCAHTSSRLRPTPRARRHR